MSDGDEKKVVKEKSKLGHRRVTEEGTVTYKKKTTSEIQQAIQMGIRTTVLSAHNMTKRDMLLKDFGVVETLSFPRGGSKETTAHSLNDFKFKTFAPIAFRYFRDFFEVDIEDYLNSICQQELRELSNAGASGSIFYITYDDEFIIKTVQHKEAAFLQKLLPEYYINLMQHPRTLLPKFYGLYCYQTMGKNIRFVIMNNLLPSIKIHEKYDLKGSTYKRIANMVEKTKSSPTLKDLDFRDNHQEGLFLEVDTYEALINTIQRDCRVLESFRIMDYSLLLGIHNLDMDTQGKRKVSKTKEHHLSEPLTKGLSVFDEVVDKEENEEDVNEILEKIEKVIDKVDKCENMAEVEMLLKDNNVLEENEEKDKAASRCSEVSEYFTPSEAGVQNHHNNNNQIQLASSSASSNQNNVSSVIIRRPLNRQASKNKSLRRIAAYSTVLESIQAPIESFNLKNSDDEIIPAGGIPARNKLGDRLILFMGIIDILQSYRLIKRLEHNMKAIFLDAETISVTNPSFYGQRFQEFFGNAVFKKIPSSMRQQSDKKPPAVIKTNTKSTESLGDVDHSDTESQMNSEVQVKLKTRVSFPHPTSE